MLNHHAASGSAYARPNANDYVSIGICVTAYGSIGSKNSYTSAIDLVSLYQAGTRGGSMQGE
jgi:hypothetical protein